ncbi:MAG: hypothetical protein U9R36_03465, partial [Elusimicrobiota bacterium]|nr:hypothetical protein [Elusimicrobiota bacterium]
MKSIYVIIIVALLAGILVNFPGGTEKAEENEKIYFSSLKRKLSEGVYRGTGEGFAGPIEVKVTFSRENSTSPVRLADIEVMKHGEIEKYWKIVEDKMLIPLAPRALPSVAPKASVLGLKNFHLGTFWNKCVRAEKLPLRNFFRALS